MEAIAENDPFCLLCIRPTGGGKSLLYQVLALHFKGVTLCISPILALGADQMRKVLQVPDRSLTAFHLDEMNDTHLVRLMENLQNLHHENAVILLSSPQFFKTRGKQLLGYLHQSHLINLVVMDELHLSHHFGRSFWPQFKSLKSLIFNRLLPLTPILLMTATCSLSIVDASEELFGVTITNQHWPSVYEMANRKQSLHATYSPLGIRYVKMLLPHYLTSVQYGPDDKALPNKVMFYANTATSVKGLSETLEEFLDSSNTTKDFDVLLVHGNLTKEEKSAFIAAFTGDGNEDTNFKIMCSTSGVANAGIDSKDVRCVFRLDLPPSIFDLVQEMGRAGRHENASAEHYHYHLFFSIEHLIYLYKQILNPEEECADERYRHVQVCDLFDIITILADPYQCHKQAIEQLLGSSEDGISRDPFPICGLCSVCQRNFEIWPLLCKEGVQLVVMDVFNSIQGTKDVDNVWNEIKKYPNAQRHLFGINSSAPPKPFDINKMLFLLIAWQMIDLNYHPSTKESSSMVTLSLSKQVSTRPGLKLMDDGFWICIMQKEPIVDYNEE